MRPIDVPAPRVLALSLPRWSPFRVCITAAYFALAIAGTGLYMQNDDERRADCRDLNKLRLAVGEAVGYSANSVSGAAHTQRTARLNELLATDLRPRRC